MQPSFSAGEHARLRARLGLRAGAGIDALQRAWMFLQPFHNLDLLAAAGGGRPPFGVEEALDRTLAGLGGPCHVQAAGFLALLRGLEFDAELAPATITYSGDHLGVRVEQGGKLWWCDVGNGHPYLSPFPVETPHVQSHLGWVIRSTPTDGRLLVERCSPDQPSFRSVYQASPSERRRWEDFATIIARHHREPGFGPFLTGLRVVRIGSEQMTTVRDDVVTVYSAASWRRTRLGHAELRRFIAEDLGLGALPVADALDVWLSSRRAA